MTHPIQASIFGDLAAAPAVDSSAFDRATEHRLDDRSWVTHVPRLLTGDERLLIDLAAATPWEQRQRWMFNRMVDEPRLTAEYTETAEKPIPLAELMATLSSRLSVPYDRIWMNWYRDHRDGTGWHADRPANKLETAVVPVLTLGATRRFLLRPSDGGPSTVFTPNGGDLLVMYGRCQRDWQHGVPKQRTPAAARMSLNFSSRAQS